MQCIQDGQVTLAWDAEALFGPQGNQAFHQKLSAIACH
jgi:hypothetical protein